MTDGTDAALRPNLPPDEAGQLRYYLRESASATMRSATASSQVAEEIRLLRGQLTGAPSLIQQLLAGGVRNAVVALVLVVSLSALIGSAVAIAWVRGGGSG